MKWMERKAELEEQIKNKIPYEEIGRRYGCSGNNVRKTAQRLGIILPKRRKINPNETFNKKEYSNVCLQCGKPLGFDYGTSKKKYCSPKCQFEYEHKDYINKWKNGEESGLLKDNFSLSTHIRRYLFEKNNNRCELCGWGKLNPNTNRIPLQVHHKDGNCQNNKEDNLQLLCPNCHSLAENFGSRNKNGTKGRSEYFGRKKLKKEIYED